MTVHDEPNRNAPVLMPNGKLAPSQQPKVWREAHDKLKGIRPEQLSRDDLAALGHEPGALNAIRQNCVQCQGGAEAEVRRCTTTWCPLWPFRMTSDPWRRRRWDQPARERAAARMRSVNERRSGNAADLKSCEPDGTDP